MADCKDSMRVNSFHSETVKSSGMFKVCTYNKDGLIEVIENPDHEFQIGTQWNTEMLRDELSYELFRNFEKASRM